MWQMFKRIQDLQKLAEQEYVELKVALHILGEARKELSSKVIGLKKEVEGLRSAQSDVTTKENTRETLVIIGLASIAIFLGFLFYFGYNKTLAITAATNKSDSAMLADIGKKIDAIKDELHKKDSGHKPPIPPVIVNCPSPKVYVYTDHKPQPVPPDPDRQELWQVIYSLKDSVARLNSAWQTSLNEERSNERVRNEVIKERRSQARQVLENIEERIEKMKKRCQRKLPIKSTDIKSLEKLLEE